MQRRENFLLLQHSYIKFEVHEEALGSSMLSTCQAGEVPYQGGLPGLKGGEVTNVPGRGLVCHNAANLKSVFILWIALWGRLRTQDLLMRWDIPVDVATME